VVPAADNFGVTLSEPTPDRAPGALDEAIALLADGRLRLRPNQSMPMQQAAEAHGQLESGNVHECITPHARLARRHAGVQANRS
jgi:hypothetical protein